MICPNCGEEVDYLPQHMRKVCPETPFPKPPQGETHAN